MPITIKELYEMAVKNGCENAQIILNYYPGDDWYAIDDYVIKKGDVKVTNGKIGIEISDEV